jgi:hypothetical protein
MYYTFKNHGFSCAEIWIQDLARAKQVFFYLSVLTTHKNEYVRECMLFSSIQPLFQNDMYTINRHNFRQPKKKI